MILHFGGVVTTDFMPRYRRSARGRACHPNVASHILRDTMTGRRALTAAECARISHREFKITLARLIGADNRLLLARALADLPSTPTFATTTSSRRPRVSGQSGGRPVCGLSRRQWWCPPWLLSRMARLVHLLARLALFLGCDACEIYGL